MVSCCPASDGCLHCKRPCKGVFSWIRLAKLFWRILTSHWLAYVTTSAQAWSMSIHYLKLCTNHLLTILTMNKDCSTRPLLLSSFVWIFKVTSIQWSTPLSTTDANRENPQELLASLPRKLTSTSQHTKSVYQLVCAQQEPPGRVSGTV